MLEYTKFILKKMSFDRILFEKELRKAIALMDPEECLQLKIWCINQFSEEFKRIISQAFAQSVCQVETELVN